MEQSKTCRLSKSLLFLVTILVALSLLSTYEIRMLTSKQRELAYEKEMILDEMFLRPHLSMAGSFYNRNNSTENMTKEVKLFPTNKLLPRRLIAVFGLESSGTKIVTEAISVASGAFHYNKESIEPEGISFHGRIDENVRKTGVEVQHISLPWGSDCQSQNLRDIFITLPVLVPRKCGCATLPLFWDEFACSKGKDRPSALDKGCTDLGFTDFVPYPDRFFINITSHIQWYEEHGVEATAVIVARDPMIQSISKLQGHCTDHEKSDMENTYGMQIITEALENLSLDNAQGRTTSNLVLVSYESVMSFGKSYFMNYLYPKLGLNVVSGRISNYVPTLHNGNKKYLNTTVMNNSFVNKHTRMNMMK